MIEKKILKLVRESKTEETIYPINKEAEKFMRFYKGVFYSDSKEYRECWIALIQKLVPNAMFGWKLGIYEWEKPSFLNSFLSSLKKLIEKILNLSLGEQMLAVDPIIYEMFFPKKS